MQALCQCNLILKCICIVVASRRCSFTERYLIQYTFPHLSTYYLRYYWWEIIVYNISITGPTNLGPYMRYYWMGPSSIKYAILLGGPSIYNMG